jgi:peroxiredoxin family protein
MIENSERIDKLEKEVRITQDSVLLIHKDLQQMSVAMTKMATSMEVMATLQTNQKVMEERCETRHSQLKEADKVLHARIDMCNLDIKAASTKDDDVAKEASRGQQAFTTLVWIGGILGSLLITTAFGLFVWAIQQKGN